MNASLPTTLPATAAPSPVAQAAAVPGSAGSASPFAQVLGQATREQAGAETASARPANPANPADGAAADAAPSPEGAPTDRPGNEREAATDAPAPRDAASDAAGLQAWLASLPGAPAAPTEAVAAAQGTVRAAAEAVGTAVDAAGDAASNDPATGTAIDLIAPARSTRSAGRGITTQAADTQPAAAIGGARSAKAAADLAAEARQFGPGSTEPVPLAPESTPWLAAEPGATPLPAALSGASPSTGSTAPAVAVAPAQAALPASPGSPQFAPQLGAQLSTFVRQGVEHASLHLNPADMGPVSVQIQLEGTAAQVRLWAEHPQTRQALEQAMPTLAGSLREAGLTLAGGGVFEQAPQPREPQQRDSRGGHRASGADDAEPADLAVKAAWLPRRRGVVDLLA